MRLAHVAFVLECDSRYARKYELLSRARAQTRADEQFAVQKSAHSHLRVYHFPLPVKLPRQRELGLSYRAGKIDPGLSGDTMAKEKFPSM